MSCCGGKCNCGDNCTCGNGSGCKMFPDIIENTTSETLIFGIAPTKAFYDGSEMGLGAKNGGCKCGTSCSCDPCSCK